MQYLLCFSWARQILLIFTFLGCLFIRADICYESDLFTDRSRQFTIPQRCTALNLERLIDDRSEFDDHLLLILGPLEGRKQQGLSLKAIHLTGNMIMDADLSRVLKAVSSNFGPDLQTLTLDDNALTDNCIPLMIEYLSSIRNEMNLASQMHGKTTFQSIPVFKNLEYLSLQGNFLTSEGVRALIQGLLPRIPLKVIYLNRNPINVDDLLAMFPQWYQFHRVCSAYKIDDCVRVEISYYDVVANKSDNILMVNDKGSIDDEGESTLPSYWSRPIALETEQSPNADISHTLGETIAPIEGNSHHMQKNLYHNIKLEDEFHRKIASTGGKLFSSVVEAHGDEINSDESISDPSSDNLDIQTKGSTHPTSENVIPLEDAVEACLLSRSGSFMKPSNYSTWDSEDVDATNEVSEFSALLRSRGAADLFHLVELDDADLSFFMTYSYKDRQGALQMRSTLRCLCHLVKVKRHLHGLQRHSSITGDAWWTQEDTEGRSTTDTASTTATTADHVDFSAWRDEEDVDLMNAFYERNPEVSTISPDDYYRVLQQQQPFLSLC